jgi:hypothetical protein
MLVRKACATALASRPSAKGSLSIWYGWDTRSSLTTTAIYANAVGEEENRDEG